MSAEQTLSQKLSQVAQKIETQPNITLETILKNVEKCITQTQREHNLSKTQLKKIIKPLGICLRTAEILGIKKLKKRLRVHENRVPLPLAKQYCKSALIEVY